MALIQWKSELDTGIPSIDSQHRRLVELVNILYRDVEAGRGGDVVAGVLTELMSYANTHFAEEERLMLACAYPGLAAHRLEHDEFSRRMRALLAKYVAGSKGLNVEALVALKTWFVTHVSCTDAAYVPALKTHRAA